MREGKKLKEPEDYGTHCFNMARAGEGGEADFFLLSAGAASATMSGLAHQFTDRVSRVAVLLINDLMPHSATFIKETQGGDYGRTRNKAGFEKMGAAFKLAVENPAVGRPLSFGWEEGIKVVEATGTKMRRHPKRNKEYVPLSTDALSCLALSCWIRHTHS